LGFTLRSSAAPAFADVVRGRLRLLLSGPASSAGRPMPDGRTPAPGGWNRIHLIVDDIAARVERLRAAGLVFRNDEIVDGSPNSSIASGAPSPITATETFARQPSGASINHPYASAPVATTAAQPPSDGPSRRVGSSSVRYASRSSLCSPLTTHPLPLITAVMFGR
jgi:hypothetical protein